MKKPGLVAAVLLPVALSLTSSNTLQPFEAKGAFQSSGRDLLLFLLGRETQEKEFFKGVHYISVAAEENASEGFRNVYFELWNGLNRRAFSLSGLNDPYFDIHSVNFTKYSHISEITRFDVSEDAVNISTTSGDFKYQMLAGSGRRSVLPGGEDSFLFFRYNVRQVE